MKISTDEGKTMKRTQIIIVESFENEANFSTRYSDDELENYDSFMEIKFSQQDEEFGFKSTNNKYSG